MKQLIDNQVDESELEELHGGSGSGNCTVDLTCGTKWFSDEDNEENIVF